MLCGYRRFRWQSIRINGGKTTLGLGSYPEITLDMARDRAFENAPSGPRLPSRACSTPSPNYSTASSAAAFRAPSIIVQLSRFDHHLSDRQGDPVLQSSGTLYAATDVATAVAEFFERNRRRGACVLCIGRRRRQVAPVDRIGGAPCCDESVVESDGSPDQPLNRTMVRWFLTGIVR